MGQADGADDDGPAWQNQAGWGIAGGIDTAGHDDRPLNVADAARPSPRIAWI
jgi:hypothetical protein